MAVRDDQMTGARMAVRFMRNEITFFELGTWVDGIVAAGEGSTDPRTWQLATFVQALANAQREYLVECINRDIAIRNLTMWAPPSGPAA